VTIIDDVLTLNATGHDAIGNEKERWK